MLFSTCFYFPAASDLQTPTLTLYCRYWQSMAMGHSCRHLFFTARRNCRMAPGNLIFLFFLFSSFVPIFDHAFWSLSWLQSVLLPANTGRGLTSHTRNSTYSMYTCVGSVFGSFDAFKWCETLSEWAFQNYTDFCSFKHVTTSFHLWALMRVLDCQALLSEFHSLKLLRESPQSPAWSRRHPSLVDKSMCMVKKMFSWILLCWTKWHKCEVSDTIKYKKEKSKWPKVSKNHNFPERHRFSQSLRDLGAGPRPSFRPSKKAAAVGQQSTAPDPMNADGYLGKASGHNA